MVKNAKTRNGAGRSGTQASDVVRQFAWNLAGTLASAKAVGRGQAGGKTPPDKAGGARVRP